MGRHQVSLGQDDCLGQRILTQDSQDLAFLDLIADLYQNIINRAGGLPAQQDRLVGAHCAGSPDACFQRPNLNFFNLQVFGHTGGRIAIGKRAEDEKTANGHNQYNCDNDDPSCIHVICSFKYISPLTAGRDIFFHAADRFFQQHMQLGLFILIQMTEKSAHSAQAGLSQLEQCAHTDLG